MSDTKKKKVRKKKENEIKVDTTLNPYLKWFNDFVISMNSESTCNYLITSDAGSTLTILKKIVFANNKNKYDYLAYVVFNNIMYMYYLYGKEEIEYNRNRLKKELEKYINLFFRICNKNNEKAIDTVSNVAKKLKIQVNTTEPLNTNVKYVTLQLYFDNVEKLKTLSGKVLFPSNTITIDSVSTNPVVDAVSGIEIRYVDHLIRIEPNARSKKLQNSPKAYTHRLSRGPVATANAAYGVFLDIINDVITSFVETAISNDVILFEPMLFINYTNESMLDDRGGVLAEHIAPLENIHTYSLSLFDGISNGVVNDIVLPMIVKPKVYAIAKKTLGVSEFDKYANIIDFSTVPYDVIVSYLNSRLNKKEKVKATDDKTQIANPDQVAYAYLNDYKKITSYTKEDIPRIANLLTGFSLLEIEHIITDTSLRNIKLTEGYISNLRAEKFKNNNLLEFMDPIDPNKIGGMTGIKNFFSVIQKAYSDDFRKQYPNVKLPNGLLLVGPAGSGKSLIARAIGSVLDMPVIQLQIEQLKGSLVGSSERKITEAFRIIKSIGKCVVFTDEIEKSIGGIESSSRSDGGTLLAMFGIILQKMQEFMDEKLPIFFVATSNDFNSLPSPILRRYENVYFVDLPYPDERKSIFEIHFKSADVDTSNIDLDALVEASEGFSGFDIQKVVNESVIKAYSDGVELTTDFMVDYIENHFFSISKSRAKEISNYRKQAKQFGWRIANSDIAVKTISNLKDSNSINIIDENENLNGGLL